MDWTLSDHYSVFAYISLNITDRDDPPAIPVLSKSSFDINLFTAKLAEFDMLFLYYYHLDFIAFFNVWQRILTDSVLVSLRPKRAKRRKLPFYFTSHTVHCVNKLESQKRKAYKRANFSESHLRDLQRDVSNSIELDKISLITSFSTLTTKDCFKLLNSLGASNHIPVSVTLDSVTATSRVDQANIFNVFLSSVYKPERFDFPPTSTGNEIRLADVPISCTEIERLLTSIPDTSTVASDNLPPFILKRCAKMLAAPIQILFTLILTHGIWPSIWKLAYVVPIHKSGPKSNVRNYRGISLLPRISLVLERILFNFIYEKVRHKLSGSQHGFRSRRSTHTQLLEYVDLLYKCVDGRESFFVVYFDIMKAFDSVSHNLLLCKLQRFGFDDAFIRLLSSYLQGRSQKVKLGDIFSGEQLVLSGVPQGSILGPLLFILFINYLPDCVANSSCFLFADDLKLLGLQHPDLLRADIDAVINWVETNGLEFHPDKTKLLSNRYPSLTMKHNPISQVDSISDLGVVIKSDLTFDLHVKTKLSKAIRILYYLKRNIPFSAPVRSKLHMYISCIRSVLLFNSCIWSVSKTSIQKLDQIQIKAVTWITGKKDYIPSLLQIDLLPVAFQIILTDLVMLMKLLQGLHEFDIFRYVAFSYPRCGTRSSQKVMFDLPKIQKTNSWRNFFYRAIDNANYISAAIEVDFFGNIKTATRQIRTLLLDKLSTSFDINRPCTYFLKCKCPTCRT